MGEIDVTLDFPSICLSRTGFLACRLFLLTSFPLKRRVPPSRYHQFLRVSTANAVAPAERMRSEQTRRNVVKPSKRVCEVPIKTTSLPLGGAGEPRPSEAAEALSAAEGSGVCEVRIG
jgi:hypothetical protein